MQSNLNSEFVHCIRSIAMWGRHSGGDEPKANPQERLSDQITFKKNTRFFGRRNVTIPLLFFRLCRNPGWLNKFYPFKQFFKILFESAVYK